MPLQLRARRVEGRAIGKLYAEHEISHAQYDQWRDQFLANVPKAFEPAGAHTTV